jgi:hypothetical protein
MTGRLADPVPDDPEIRRLLDPYRLPDGRPLPLFEALAHSRAALDDLRRATAACLGAPALDARTREIAVLRVCARAGAETPGGSHTSGATSTTAAHRTHRAQAEGVGDFEQGDAGERGYPGGFRRSDHTSHGEIVSP